MVSKVVIRIVIIWAIIETIIALLQFCHVLDNGHEIYTMSGTFANPSQLGCLLSLSSVLLVGIISGQKNHPFKLANIFILTFQIAVIILTDSRASFLAVIIGILATIHKKKRFNRHLILLLTILFLALCIGLYLIRPDSVWGRILIWCVSITMVLDKPLKGFGHYGFQKNYMLYQADFLKNSSHSIWEQFADNIAFPYNEYIHILVDYGIVGLVLFIFIIVMALKAEIVDNESWLIKYAIISFCSFSLFSYPLYTYRLFLLFFTFCLSLILQHWKVYKNGFPCIICIIAIICYGTYHAAYEYTLKTTVEDAISSNNVTRELSTSDYQRLRQYPFVMDIYVQATYNRKPTILFDAIAICPSTFIFCRIGDLFQAKNDVINAEYYYRTASHMVPKLIHPKYKLFMLLYNNERYEDAFRIGDEIMSTEYQIRGTELLRMIADIQDLMHKSGNTSNLNITNEEGH